MNHSKFVAGGHCTLKQHRCYDVTSLTISVHNPLDNVDFQFHNESACNGINPRNVP